MKLAPGMIIVLASAMPDFDEKREEFANNMFQRMFADQSQDMWAPKIKGVSSIEQKNLEARLNANWSRLNALKICIAP